MHQLTDYKGTSLLEVIIAMALFGLLAATLVSMSIGGYETYEQGGEFTQAEALAQEGIEAIRTIRHAAWNELTVTTSSVSTSTGAWGFDGEGTTETIGQYTRTISFEDVCRDGNDDIVSCPGTYTDVQAKLALVTVDWTTASGATQTVERRSYLTNWDGINWVQTNWTGGGGQSIWLNEDEYDTGSNIDTSLVGQITLASIGGGATCATNTWPFTTSSNYTYNPTKIAVSNGVASLVAGAPVLTKTWPLTTSSNYTYDTNAITIASGLASLVFQPANGTSTWNFDVSSSYSYSTTSISVASGTASLLIQGDPVGTIADAIIDDEEYQLANILDPSIAHVSGTVYVIGYEHDTTNDGFLITRTISDTGVIGTSNIDIVEFDVNGRESRVFQVSDGIFGVVYRGANNDGWIKTYPIDAVGNIGTEISSFEFDPLQTLQPEITHVSGDIYAIVYRGDGNDGFVRTVDITSAGVIGAVQDGLEFSGPNIRDPSIAHVTGTIYAIAYEHDNSNDGFIATVDIASNGAISNSVIEDLEFDDANGRNPDVIRVGPDMVAIAYRGNSADGYIATVQIDATGDILTDDVIDSREYDLVDGSEPNITFVGDDIYAIVHADPNDQGFVSTVQISSAGTITPGVIDTLEYNTANGDDARILHVTGNIFAIVHQGAGDDGFVTTVDISTSADYPSDGPSIEPTETAEGSLITAYTAFTEVATKNGGEIYYQLSDDEGITWQYWDGGSWAVAGASQSSTASTINTNIGSFPTSSNKIMFKAFLVGDGSQQVILDTVSITYDRSTSGYATNGPTVTPVAGEILSLADLDTWVSFAAVASSTAGGSVRYQLSSDSGSTWSYWNGSSWAVATTGQYNTQTEVNTNIATFTTSTGSLSWRAFLISDGSQQVTFDTATIGYRLNLPDAQTVGLWHLDEASGNFIDSSGNGNDLTPNGTPTYNQSGQFNTAIAFDSNSDYGSIADGSHTGLEPSGAITIEAWINKTTAGTDRIVRKWSGGTNKSYFLGVTNGNAVQFGLRSNLLQTIIASPNSSITPGTWHHIAATYDGTTMRIFVDGIEVQSGLHVGGIQDSTALFIISDNGGGSFNGLIDEVRISSVARWTTNFTPPTGPYGSSGSEYPTDLPTIQPASPYTTSVDKWAAFADVVSTTAGAVYYQLSDDGGTNWKYWNGSAWVIAGAGQYNTSTLINANIETFPTASSTISWRAFLESDGDAQIEIDEVAVNCTNLQFEVGQISTDENWVTINFANAYKQPVVVASFQESNNTLPASIRMRNMTTTSIDIRLQNPAEADLNSDQITFFAIEKGTWDLNGMQFEANTHDTNTVGYKNNWSWDTVTYQESWTTSPMVMHSIMTSNDTSWITSYLSSSGSRTAPPGTTNFGLSLNGAEAVTSHGATETIGWVAIDRDETTTFGSVLAETDLTSDSVTGHDNGCTTFSYTNSYSSAPAVLGFQQEQDGNDGSWGVVCSNSSSQIGLYADEDQETDSERQHTTETFAFFAVANTFSSTTAGGGGGSFQTAGSVQSSAFNMGDISPVQVVSWDEDASSCAPGCDIQVQVRTAPDSGGSPGTWTSWYGAAGVGSYFTSPTGTVATTSLNTNQWVQYRVELSGDGSASPVLEEIRINYK